MAKVIRSVKNVTKGYSSVQIKVREATSNDPWGPTGLQMQEIAQLTYNATPDFYEIVDMIDKRLNDKGKNWRHVLKALKVLDYCLHEGCDGVVTWSKQNIYVIKTLCEFQYIDDEGRDVGNNVRVAATQLTALLNDDERLLTERSDRRSWKGRVAGLDDLSPSNLPAARPRRQPVADDDTEYRLAIEASKQQEEEDRRKRASRNNDNEDDDLARAIQLSKEEEERRRRELDESNASSLIDDTLTQTQPQATGYNQGYTQGNQVDWFANPVGQSQQPGYLGNAYTGFTSQQTGYPNGLGMQPTGFQQQGFPPQVTGANPYMMQQRQQPEPVAQTGSNNPWASNNPLSAHMTANKPMPTGSNNPFASSFGPRPAVAMQPSLSSLPEQKTLASFGTLSNNNDNNNLSSFAHSTPSFPTNTAPTPVQQPQQPQQPPQPQQPQRETSEHAAKLNALLASGEGMDTFGNTGDLRIPAQHTAPGHFVNSAGAGAARLTAEATGSNPFLRSQFTGLPDISYGGRGGGPGQPQLGMSATGAANPFSSRPPGQQPPQGGQGDLIQF